MSGFSIGPFILMYHSIAEGTHDPYTVSAADFRNQLKWLCECGYEVISLPFLVQSIKKQDHGILNKKVVITFDDGYQDFISNALPVLQDYGATATVFLVTDMLGQRASWNSNGPQSQLMSEEEVRSVKSRGISLGSHTSTHANLTLLNYQDLQKQLEDSRNRLQNLGETFMAFSYPWGQWSDRTAQVVRNLGYECALSVGELTSLAAGSIYCLPRITMSHMMDMKRFQKFMTRNRFGMELRRRYRILRGK